MTEGFKHLFQLCENKHNNSIDYSGFMAMKDIYHFILPHNTPAEQNILDIGKNLNTKLFEQFIKVPKPNLGYTNDTPYQELDVNDCKHITISTIIFTYCKYISTIIEIGGGYGNLVRLNEPIVPYKKWSIIDLPFVCNLQRWYLDRVLINPKKIDIISAYEYINYVEKEGIVDLVIATHSLSELSWDDFIEYFDNLLVNTRYFFYSTHTFNCGAELLQRKLNHINTIFEPIYTTSFKNHDHNTLYHNKKIPFVSIIIPTYERYEQLSTALDSALEQDTNVEVIVIDDCSKDKRYWDIDKNIEIGLFSSNIRVIHLEQNTREKYNFHSAQGIVKNIGIENARGEWIAFLDDDDKFVSPQKLNLQIKYMNKYNCKMSSTNMYCGNGKYTHNSNYPLYHKTMPNVKEIVEEDICLLNKDEVRVKNYINNSTVVLHKSLLDGKELFKLVQYEDHELWLRLLDYTKCVYIHQPLCYYDIGSSKFYHNL